MINIDEGKANIYLVHGVFAIIIGCVLAMTIHFTIFIPFIVLAVGLFMSTNGLTLNFKSKTYTKYSSIFGYKIGKPQKIEYIISATLILSIERAKTNQAMIMGEAGRSKSMTYDIVLMDEFGESTLLHDFIKYRHAIKALERLKTHFEIQTFDKVLDKLQQNKRNARR